MKFKSLIMILLIGCMGLILSACSDSGKSSSTKQSQTSQTKSTDTASTQKSQTSSSSSSKASSSNTDPFLIIVRMDGVINATLHVESKKPQTAVNYKTRSMTQNGKKVTFSLIPTAKHQNDFQEGAIQEIIANGKTQVLYNFKIDNANNVSLIDPASNKVIYKTVIQDSSMSSPTSNANQ